LSFAYMILLFNVLGSVIHTLIAAIAYYNPAFSYANFMNECCIGFSGIIFALLVVNIGQTQSRTTSIFGFFNVPTKLYPWALLVIFQLLMPGVSFLGHLSGILVGYLYTYGFLNKLLLPTSVLNGIESSHVFGYVVMRDGYISNPNLGSHPNSFSIPFMSSPTQQPRLQLPSSRPSLLSNPSTSISPSMPTIQSSNDNKFPGTGHTLGSSV